MKFVRSAMAVLNFAVVAARCVLFGMANRRMGAAARGRGGASATGRTGDGANRRGGEPARGRTGDAAGERTAHGG